MGVEAITGKEVPPMPLRWSAWAVYETYDTSDGDKVFIGITSDNHWWRFCEHFDRPDMLNDPTLATNEDRVAARDRVKPFVAEVIGRHTMADIVRICEDIGIPFAPVARTKDLFDDPQLNAHGRMLRTTLPNGGMTKLPRLPIEMDSHELGLRLRPPRVGEQGRAILAELGLDDAEITALERDGIVVSTDAKEAAE